MADRSIRSLFLSLNRDPWRTAHPFTDDIQKAQNVLFNPFASHGEVITAMRAWLRDHQPCVFGRMGAQHGFIHIAVLDEHELQEDDRTIIDKITQQRILWKRRALTRRQNPPHSFVLLIRSPRVANAAPDRALHHFSRRMQELAGWKPASDAKGRGKVASDFLYISQPDEGKTFLKFRFTVDYFAAAGDGRWWHDHRAPGGIMFTANSTGHMKAFQEMYLNKGEDRGPFILHKAMHTIANACPVAHMKAQGSKTASDGPGGDEHEGRATWLLPLRDGSPLLPVPYPFGNKPLPKIVENKDWTRYEGLLHTDHAVRPEFFDGSESAPTSDEPHLMDFRYLYDKTQQDYWEMTAGLPVSLQEIEAEIGRLEDWEGR